MKALVTGATGFIGSQLIKTLENNGYSLRIISRKNNSVYDTVICDLGNDQIPESALDSIDIVFHLAGYTHDLVSTPNKDRIYYDLNVKATVDLMKIAAKNRVSKFIYISSVKAGGMFDKTKCMTENDQGAPNDIYGATKREAEIEILRIGQSHNIHVSIIRPALVYGVKMKGNLAIMLNGIKSGWFPPLPETNNKRSMICINDLIDAILLIASDKRTNSKVYIATDGHHYSSRDIYKAMCQAVEKNIPIWTTPIFIFSILAWIGDIVKYIPFNSHRYKKIFGNECYSSVELQKLGFTPKYDLFSYLKKYGNSVVDNN